MPTSDPRAISYINASLRPAAESVRNLKAQIDAMLINWNATIDPMVPNDGTAVVDGRDAEGINRPTSAQVRTFVGYLTTLQTQLNGANVAAGIAIMCVRALQVQ